MPISETVERYAGELKWLRARIQDIPNLYTEIDNAIAEIERLRAALEQAVDDFGEGHCVCEQTKQECIAALEPKP